MRYLIDINHPAHVHLFKNVATDLISNGHDVLFTTRKKEIAHVLLERYGLPFKCLGPHYKSMLGKLYGIVKYDLLILREAISFKPDLFLSMGSIYNSHVSFILRKPNILLQDTENAHMQHKLSYPFASLILNPACYYNDLGPKQFRYDGYHELAYVHPNRFTPDPSYLRAIGVEPGEKFTILRFVSWNANHDLSHKGLSNETKIKAAKEFLRFGKIFISAEGELPEELRPFSIRIPPEKIHHIMAFASLLYGESATMASECSIFGVPSIFLNDGKLGYLQEQEHKFGLVFNFSESEKDQQLSIERGVEILSGSLDPTRWKDGRDRILASMMDVSSFLVWLLSGYPQSVEELRRDPVNIQSMFKYGHVVKA